MQLGLNRPFYPLSNHLMSPMTTSPSVLDADHRPSRRSDYSVRPRALKTRPSAGTDLTSDASSEVDVQMFPTYIQMTYGGQNFYNVRERFSAHSSLKGVAIMNDSRREDQIGSESALSPLNVHEDEMFLQAVRIANLMWTEF